MAAADLCFGLQEEVFVVLKLVLQVLCIKVSQWASVEGAQLYSIGTFHFKGVFALHLDTP